MFNLHERPLTYQASWCQTVIIWRDYVVNLHSCDLIFGLSSRPPACRPEGRWCLRLLCPTAASVSVSLENRLSPQNPNRLNHHPDTPLSSSAALGGLPTTYLPRNWGLALNNTIHVSSILKSSRICIIAIKFVTMLTEDIFYWVRIDHCWNNRPARIFLIYARAELLKPFNCSKDILHAFPWHKVVFVTFCLPFSKPVLNCIELCQSIV